MLRSSLNEAGLGNIKIVAPDAPHIDDWKICVDLMKDPELAAAVDIVGLVVCIVFICSFYFQ